MLCVIDVFINFVWTTPLNDKKGVTNVNALQKKIYKSNWKPNKISVDQGSEFYNNSLQSWFGR